MQARILHLINQKQLITPHHSGSHHVQNSPNLSQSLGPPLKALSQPSRIHCENKSPELSGLIASVRESAYYLNKTPPARNNTVGIKSNSESPTHFDRASKINRTEPLDEWESIERELLGTIEEDNTFYPEKQSPSNPRQSIVSERSDLLELLLQQGLTPEIILNASEEELLLVLERSLLSDQHSTTPLPQRRSTEDLENRLAFLEKQLLGDF